MNIVKKALKSILTPRRRERLRRIYKKARYFGLSRYCPVCNSHLQRFHSFGVIARPEAQCPVCWSLERHRLIYLYLSQRTNLFDRRPKTFLHVAPEPEIARLIKTAPNLDYLSADLFMPEAMVKMDITDIQYPDESFDIIYCSHVLEHVLDDRKAMREFHRVLKTGGWAILQVPLFAEPTFEDPAITSPEEREKHFGQRDHVRKYGPDYRDRLVQAGFSLKLERYAGELHTSVARKYGLQVTENVYLVTKHPQNDDRAT